MTLIFWISSRFRNAQLRMFHKMCFFSPNILAILESGLLRSIELRVLPIFTIRINNLLNLICHTTSH